MPDPPAPAAPTARARARAQITREITGEARRQLASVGAARLSLRAVARELGMASSAVYRYFPSRDELLTALIVEAYDALGAAVEAAEMPVPRDDVRGRFRAVLHAVRTWARQHPHEYALLYGSPVPGYRAPEQTLVPAARVAVLLIAVVRDAAPAAVPTPTVAPALSEQLDAVATAFGLDVPRPVVARLLMAWTQLFGVVSMELFGHLVGTVDPGEDFFGYVVEELADLVRLPPGAG